LRISSTATTTTGTSTGTCGTSAGGGNCRSTLAPKPSSTLAVAFAAAWRKLSTGDHSWDSSGAERAGALARGAHALARITLT
jgi:hypothetical protein